jgi:hypothetical protein
MMLSSMVMVVLMIDDDVVDDGCCLGEVIGQRARTYRCGRVRK